MIRIREVRFWTALVVAGLSALAVGQGMTASRLALAELTADPATAEGKFAPFVSDGLVGDIATRDALRLAPSLSPADAAATIGQLLAQTPLNSGAWLDLAASRRASGASTESVAAALAMSTTTGPNERRLMAGRAGFALPFWSALPPGARQAVVADLTGGWAGMDETARARILALLRNAPDGSGEEVRAALLLNGGDSPKIAAAITPPVSEGDAAAESPRENGAGK